MLLNTMDLIQIYQCFCDRTRLRILHLLTQTPLCVCHFQDILDEPQVKISKHLAYLRERGLVVAEREQNWMIYSLPEKRAAELESEFEMLTGLRADRSRLSSAISTLGEAPKNARRAERRFDRQLITIGR